ncbi:Basal-body rod modification protein FlgD [Durusdinium trenchii]|uniref:Basal-body rod modification protein FlgD n=1 Tax=Durusdinium trenchii TaxID=1381693 RepID=A0ABP0LKK6_9DINO
MVMEAPIFPVRAIENGAQQAPKKVEGDRSLKPAGGEELSRDSDDSFADHMEKDAQPGAREQENAGFNKRDGDQRQAADSRAEKSEESAQTADKDSKPHEITLAAADGVKTVAAASSKTVFAVNVSPAAATDDSKGIDVLAHTHVQTVSDAGKTAANSFGAPQPVLTDGAIGEAVAAKNVRTPDQTLARPDVQFADAPKTSGYETSIVQRSDKVVTAPGGIAGAIELPAGLETPADADIVLDDLIEVEIPRPQDSKAIKHTSSVVNHTAASSSLSALQSSADLNIRHDGEIEIKPLLGGQNDLSMTKLVAAQAAQAATPTQPASSAAAASAAAQIVAAIKTEAKSGNIELRLDPPEMGRVRMNLSIETADAVKAVLTVERPETLDHLRRNMNQFIDDLKMANAAATAASDFQSFLQLLTAQMRNQDPLSPIDSTQFVEQLASFSSVEQQIETNKKLDALTAGLAGADLETATQWVGKDVEVVNSTARFNGAPVTFGVPDTTLGDVQREYAVRNASGDVIHRAPIASGAREFTWDGTTANGNTAPIGDYSISVDFIADGAVAETQQPLARGRVTEARFTGDSDVQLVLSNGVIIDTSDIRAVREPQASATGA